MILFFMLSVATAGEPTFTILSKGQTAPFDGALLSPDASAEVLTKVEDLQSKCEIQIQHEIDKSEAQCSYEKDILQIRIDTISEQNKKEILLKDQEIENLKEVIKKQSPNNKWLWFAGGIILGGASYYGIQRATR